MIKLYDCKLCKTEDCAKTVKYWELGDKGKRFIFKDTRYTELGDEYGHKEECPEYQKWPKYKEGE